MCIAVYLIKLFQSSPLLDFLFVFSSHQFPRFCNLQIYNANKHHFVRFLYKVYVYFDDVFLTLFGRATYLCFFQPNAAMFLVNLLMQCRTSYSKYFSFWSFRLIKYLFYFVVLMGKKGHLSIHIPIIDEIWFCLEK